MIVTITSLVPRKAFKKPGMAAIMAPHAAPMIITSGIMMARGKSGKLSANQTEEIQPAKA